MKWGVIFMSIKKELYLTDRETAIIRHSLLSSDKTISSMKEYLKILSSCSKSGEEYEVIEADVLNLLEKINNFSNEELQMQLRQSYNIEI